jgi:hypothetical protein
LGPAIVIVSTLALLSIDIRVMVPGEAKLRPSVCKTTSHQASRHCESSRIYADNSAASSRTRTISIGYTRLSIIRSTKTAKIRLVFLAFVNLTIIIIVHAIIESPLILISDVGNKVHELVNEAERILQTIRTNCNLSVCSPAAGIGAPTAAVAYTTNATVGVHDAGSTNITRSGI